jgi:ribosomal-protein-alanine N-acetyltransferase
MIILGDVVLRPLEPKDVDSLYGFRNDWDVIQYLVGFSAGYSRANLEAWIKTHSNRADEVLWTIADKATDRSIGHVGLYRIDNRVRKAEFGIVVGDRSRWNSGLGHRITDAVLGWAFAQLNLHKVTLTVLMDNPRAIHLYEAIGFQREGVLRDEQFRDGAYRDVLMMSLLEGEWRRHPVEAAGQVVADDAQSGGDLSGKRPVAKSVSARGTGGSGATRRKG